MSKYTIQTKKILFFAVFVLASFAMQAQGFKQKLADKYYNELSYFKAVEVYEDLAQRKNPTAKNLQRTAECYRLIGDAKNAEKWYEKLVASGSSEPQDYYYYAQMLKMNQKYDLANKQMSKFYEMRANNSVAEAHVSADDYVEKLKKNKGNYTVTNLGDKVNSEYSDFAPTAYMNKKLVFASSRRNNSYRNEKSQWDGQYYSDIYSVKISDDWQIEGSVEPFASSFRTKFHEGPASFTADGNTMYITKSNVVDGKKVYSKNRLAKLQIFVSKKDGEKWGELESFPFNNKEINIAHASISPDGQKLFFSMEENEEEGIKGKGGKDIWMCEKLNDGSWSAPINVESINTEGDELFPHASESGVLYFSSDGHLGLGGLDIFKAEEKGGRYTVKNMGFPINTSDDDFSLVLNKEENYGFFSSNRAEGSFGRDDIYSVKIEQMPVDDSTLVQITIADAEKGFLLEGVKVVMVDTVTGERYVFITDSLGSAEGMIKTVDDLGRLQVTLSKDKYFDNTFNVTEDMFNENAIRIDELLQLDTGLVNRYCKINEILFDFESWEIRPDAAAELDKLVSCMKNNERMIIEIGSHTDCIGPKKYNKRLSSKRAKSSREYVISKGIDPDRIFGKGYGEDKILNRCECEMPNWRSDCSDEEHQVNRRTEFRIVKGGAGATNNSTDSFDQ